MSNQTTPQIYPTLPPLEEKPLQKKSSNRFRYFLRTLVLFLLIVTSIIIVALYTKNQQQRFEKIESSINQNQNTSEINLVHNSSDDPMYDKTPVGALNISAPLKSTTRNYTSGIFLTTNGSEVDKGRGIFLWNVGKSDGLYVQQDGSYGTGIAVLQTANAENSTGMVIGTQLASQNGLVLRQETALNKSAQSSSLLTVEANGSNTEMVRVNSIINNQVGIIFRMAGNNSMPIVVQDPKNNNAITFQLNSDGSAYFKGAITSAVAKNFEITNPLDPSKKLVHSSLEGPEIAVYYRGKSKINNFTSEVILPDYFESLTLEEGRTVQLTAIGDSPFVMSTSEVKDGKFIVHSSVESAEFYWEVKAVRKDVPALQVNK